SGSTLDSCKLCASGSKRASPQMLVPSDWFAGWLKGLEPISSTTTRRVYLDHSATTPVDERVLEAMLPYLTHRFGNPSSVHSFGQEARAAVDRARREVAELVGARANEIVFLSGGTEANNLAVRGLCQAVEQHGR